MEPLSAFALAAATGVALAVSVCLLLRRSLDQLLNELCGGAVRGRFWLLFGNVTIVLSTLWVSLWFFPGATGATGAAYVVRVFVRTLGGATFGLLLALALLGLTLLFGIGSYNARMRHSPVERSPGSV